MEEKIMMKLWSGLIAMVLALTLCIGLAACGTGSKDSYSKYSPGITITTMYRVTPGYAYQNKDSIENTNWTRLYKTIGINLKSLWTADSGQYDNKLNMTVASGDIPDIMPMLMAQHVNKLVKSDMLADLTPYLNDYLTLAARKMLYGTDGKALDGLDIKGKLYCAPMYTSDAIMNATKALWVRKDWLDKVGLPVPKTLDDFLRVCDAFTNNDPDGNMKNDTYGVALPGKDCLIYNMSGMDAFAQMWHVNPIVWWDSALFYEKDSSGKVILSASKQGMKDCLTTMADMYKKGYISKDFATADFGGKVKQDVTSGKVGMLFGSGWGMPWWFFNNLKQKDTKADWYVTFIPTADGQPTKVLGYQPSNAFWGVSANCKNPEAVVKILNLYVDKYNAKKTDKTVADNYFSSDPEDAGKSGAVISCTSPDEWRDHYNAVKTAVTSKDTSKLTQEQKTWYDDVVKYNTNKDPKAWATWMNFAGMPGTCLYHMYEEITPDMLQNNAFMSIGTDLMTSKVPQYKKMAEETITKIIYGKAPVTEWDNVIANWAKLGGDDILKEVQKQAE